MERELLDQLAARRGHFQFESGHHGDLCLDLDALFLRPSRLRPFIAELATRLAKYNPQAVCGPMVGGALLAQSVAGVLDVEFYFAERVATTSVRYQIPNSLRGLLAGKHVAIVDDAINAGSAVRGTVADLRSCVANPVAIGALVALGDADIRIAKEHNIPVETLAHLTSNLWAPSACPLCASHALLENPTL
jgi:orotate phosphoribosyltransferase